MEIIKSNNLLALSSIRIWLKRKANPRLARNSAPFPYYLSRRFCRRCRVVPTIDVRVFPTGGRRRSLDNLTTSWRVPDLAQPHYPRKPVEALVQPCNTAQVGRVAQHVRRANVPVGTACRTLAQQSTPGKPEPGPDTQIIS
jgi:hypothetical protein